MIISMDTKNAFDKIQHLSLQKPGIEVTNLNIIKSIFENPTINITLNGEKLKISLLKPCPPVLSPKPPEAASC